jgi:Protein of unknown function (DUF3830)
VLELQIGDIRFEAQFEERAPATVEAVRRLLPLDAQVIHVRWSGESLWIPLGELDVGLGVENATTYPALGQLLFYPGGISETELLLPYGACSFASKAGPLAGNHFATIRTDVERLREIGIRCLWEGAQPIRLTETYAV